MQTYDLGAYLGNGIMSKEFKCKDPHSVGSGFKGLGWRGWDKSPSKNKQNPPTHHLK